MSLMSSPPLRRRRPVLHGVARPTGALTALVVSTSLLSCAASAGSEDHARPAPTTEACSIPIEPGVNEIPLTSDGVSRPFLLYVPASYDGHTPIPVVINGHGSTSDGEEHLAYSA